MNQSLDPNVLGRLLLIQSTLHIMPNESQAASFLNEGFRAVPGIQECGLLLEDGFYANNKEVFSGLIDSCRAYLKEQWSGKSNPAEKTAQCQCINGKSFLCHPVATSSRLYGELLILKNDDKIYNLYHPFIENTVNLLALILENRDQQKKLESHHQILEQEITRRTEELRQESRERKAVEEKLHQAEKMQAIGQLAGGIAHDFNNQLAGISGYAELLLDYLKADKKLASMISKILIAANRAADLTKQLLAFARKGKNVSMIVNLHEMISEVIHILEHTIDKRIEIQQESYCETAFTNGDPSQIQNAIMNLALNARDAMPQGGRLTFSIDKIHLSQKESFDVPVDIGAGEFIQLLVKDNGAGIPSDIKKKIFEPFFTTKAVGKGTGMGLASVYGTIKNHGGAIQVQSEYGHGTVMKLYFPSIKQSKVKKKDRKKTENHSFVQAHILLIDDEDFVLDTTALILAKRGYKLSIYNQSRQGLDYFNKNWKEIDLVILDLIMPVLSGREVFFEIRKINPKIKILLSSGFSFNDDIKTLLAGGFSEFIQKPYQEYELLEKIEQLLST